MTIERQEPGIWRAICDECGDDVVLDTDGASPEDEAQAELEALGWVARPVETAKFATDMGSRKFEVQYRGHDCPDCQ